MSELIEVRILDLPLDLHARSAAHSDALQREFELIRRAEGSDDTVPARLRALVDDLKGRFGDIGEGPLAEIARARDAGQTHVSLTYHVPAAAGPASADLQAALREADDYCRAGDLMTLATPPDQVAFRDWFLGEFIGQIDGRAPQPWASVDQPAPAGQVAGDHSRALRSSGAQEAPATDGWRIDHDGTTARIGFSGELDLESAPRLRTVVAQACQHEPAAVVLDLSEVTFLDSVGLSALLTIQLRLDADEVDVEMVVSPVVRRVFQLAGVTELFGV